MGKVGRIPAGIHIGSGTFKGGGYLADFQILISIRHQSDTGRSGTDGGRSGTDGGRFGVAIIAR